jgi:hypothetical protein
MEQEISYIDEPTPAPEGGLQYVDDVGAPTAMPGVIVAKRAEEMDYAMGDKSPGYEDLQDKLYMGDEDYERRYWAHSKNMEKQQVRRDILEELVLNRPDQATPELINSILSLRDEDLADPATALEKSFAARTVSDVVTGAVPEALDDIPEEAINAAMDPYEDIIARARITQKKREDQEARYQAQSTLGTVANWTALLLPGVSFAVQEWAEEPGVNSRWLPGTSKLEQYQWLNLLPPDQYEKVLTRIVDDLNKINPLEARIFLAEVQHYSTVDKVLENAGGVLDLVTLGLPKAVSTFNKLNRSLKGAAKAAGAPKVTVQAVHEATGNLEEAAHLEALKAVQGRAENAGSPFADMGNKVVSLVNIQKTMEGAMTYLSADQAIKLKASLQANAGKLLGGVLNDPILVDRLTRDSSALNTAVKSTMESIKTRSKTVQDSVLGLRHEAAEKNIGLDVVVAEYGKITKPVIKGGKKAKGAPALKQPSVPGLKDHQLDYIKTEAANGKDAATIAKELRNSLSGKHITEAMVSQAVTGLTTPVKNMPNVSVAVGMNSVELFDNVEQAIRYAKEDIGLDQFKVKTRGGKFYIEERIPVREDLPTIRNELVRETSALTPHSAWTNMYFNWFKSIDSKMSPDMVKENKMIYGASSLVGLMKEAAAPIQKLSKQSMQDMDDFLAFQRDYDRADGTGVGRSNKTVGEFGIEWERNFNRPPTFEEIDAYMTMRQMNDIGFAMTNVGLTVAKGRLGMFNARIPLLAENLRETPKLEVTLEKEINWNNGDFEAGILVWDADPSKWKAKENYSVIGRAGASKQKTDALINANGYKVLQLTEVGQQALRAVPELKDFLPQGPLNYILVKDFQRSNLDLRHIPYQDGFRVEYAPGWYLRQPNIKKAESATGHSTYYGDKNLHWFATKAEATKFHERFQKAQGMLKAHRDMNKQIEKLSKQATELRSNKKPGQAVKVERERNALEAKMAQNALDLEKHFRGTMPGKIEKWRGNYEGDDPFLDLDTPLYVTRSDESVDKAHNLKSLTGADGKPVYHNYRNIKDSPYNKYNQSIDLRFAMERDDPISTIAEEGSKTNPLYKNVPARKLDARGVLDRSTTYLARSRYLNDYKIKAAEHFIEEFKDLSRYSVDELRQDPMKHLFSDDFFRDGLSGDKYTAAKDVQRSVREIVHVKNELDRQVHWFRQQALDTVFGFSQKAGEYVEPWVLHKIKDPAQYFKNVAFHLKMLSPHQLVTQALSHVHIAARVGIDRAVEALPHSMLIDGLRWTENPKMLDKASEYASEFGMKPEHFKEMFTGWKRSGAWRVDKEVGEWQDYLNTDILHNPANLAKGGQWVLDKGKWFYKTGERASRTTAWVAAYQDWRRANPKAEMDNKALKQIRNKMDDFTGNMTSASNAQWQKGMKGIVTQFMSYPVRISEQFLGKRTTAKEKARMFAVYGLTYGIPGAAATAVPYLPWSDWFREYTAEKGIDTDANAFVKLISDGMMSNMIEDTIGAKVNVQENYANGLTIFADALTGDKTMAEVLAGVSGTSIYDMLKTSEPALAWALSTIAGERYPITAQDWSEFASNSSMFNNFRKAWDAAMYGKAFTKEGAEITDVAPSTAVMNVLMGVQDMRVADTYNYGSVLRDSDKHKREVRKDVKFEMEAMMAAVLNDDPETAEKHRIKAQMHFEEGQFTPAEQASIWADVMRINQNKASEMAKKFNEMPPQVRELYFKRMRQTPDGQ